MKDLMQELIPILIPYTIAALTLGIVALLDLRKRSAFRGPKWMWIAFIFFTGLLGPLAYFMLGRKDE